MDDIHNHKFIILGGDGLNPLGIIWSLGEEGITPYIISNNESKSLISTSKYVKQVYYTDKNESVIDILITIFGKEDNKPFVFLTDEGNAVLLDQRYDEIKDSFYFFDMGEKGKLTRLTDKSEQCQLASSCGFNVPKYEILEKGSLPKYIEYPIITKTLSPNEGQWKKDMYVCYSEEDLISAYKKIEASRLIAEEYIKGDYEFDIKGISINGGREVCFTYSKVWNSSKEVFPSIMRFQPFTDNNLRNCIQEIMRSASYSGIFDVEFIHSTTGKLYFLEVNWRTGMYNYNHTRNGFNIPFLWALFSLKGYIDSSYITLRSSNYSSFDELVSFSTCLRKPKLLKAWTRTLKSSDYIYYYNRSDLRPCINAWRRFFSRKIASLWRAK